MRVINALIPNNNNKELHTVVKGIGAEVGFGYVAADEYGHEASKAQHRRGCKRCMLTELTPTSGASL